MQKKILIVASLLGGFSVILGAFAAHQLKAMVSADELQIFETGVKYQMYHALALLATGMLISQYPVKELKWAAVFFVVGIFLFSGSLYLLCFIKYQQINGQWVGAITPLGGLCMIAGWVLLALGFRTKSRTTIQ